MLEIKLPYVKNDQDPKTMKFIKSSLSTCVANFQSWAFSTQKTLQFSTQKKTSSKFLNNLPKCAWGDRFFKKKLHFLSSKI